MLMGELRLLLMDVLKRLRSVTNRWVLVFEHGGYRRHMHIFHIPLRCDKLDLVSKKSYKLQRLSDLRRSASQMERLLQNLH